jgi:hypothetical protein
VIRAIRPWMIVLVFLIGYIGVIYQTNDRDAKAFVTLGSCFLQCTGHDGEDCNVPDEASLDEQFAIEGYDGQFNYFIARDPSQAPPCIDVPAYRYQRILLPILGRALAVGNESIIPWAFVLINGLALVIGTRLLEDLLVAEGRKFWFALSYGLYFGVVIATRFSTSEPLAYGLVIAAMWAHHKKNSWLTAIFLGLAGLSKETTGLFAAGFIFWYAANRRWGDVLRLIVLAGLPFIAWQLYLYDWLGEFGAGSGGAKATGFEVIPFMGVIRILTEGNILAFLLLGGLWLGAPVILPTLWGLREVWRDFRTEGRPITLYTWLLLTSALVMPFVPFSTYREFLGIFRFIPGLVLMVILYSAERDLRRPLMYSTLWIVLLLFLVVG